MAALRADGLTAPLVLDGPLMAPPSWPEQFLAPTLHPGDSVVLDNLACHKVAGVAPPLRLGGVIYLPPYSPDFNPIEQVFAQLKARLRAGAPRTVTRLWTAVGSALAAVSPPACANYIRHAGYRLATTE